MVQAPRCIILQVVDPHRHADWALHDLAEGEQLIQTYGGVVVERSVQHRVHPHPDTYIGPGKVAWLQDYCKTQRISIVVLNGIVNSGQLFRLEKALWSINPTIKVWDRVDLILHIFEQHASSTEAKLQIRIARLQHLGPRAYGLGGTVLSRQGGGIGTRGLGETNLERERRAAKRQLQQLRSELKELAKDQAERINRRRENGIKTVALVGYTSAGKTLLFNTLTKKRREVSEKLFTTLDSVVGRFRPAGSLESLIVSDTIGFIDNLPPLLIDAFKTTLLESMGAHLVLHVADATDERVSEKILAVDDLLREMRPDAWPTVLVFTKLDQLPTEQRQRLTERYVDRQPVFISSKTGEGIDQLKALIAERCHVRRQESA